MPSFAMARGLNYYVLLPPGGPLYSSLYGPMAAVTYLPAALFSSPNSAVLAGAAITALLCFLAAAFVHFAGLKPGGKSGDVLAFLALGFLMCFLEPLKYSCFNIHADGPGLALGAFACGALYSSRLKKWRIALPVSALCAVLCVFCKQMFLPLPLVLLLYFWLAEGRRQATRYLLWLAAAGGIAVTAAAMAFGLEPLYHCLIWIPGHHPWYPPSRMVSAMQAMRSSIRVSMPVPIILLAGLIYVLSGARLRGQSLRALAANRCVPLLMAGVALAPFSIAGRAKVGGDVNSLSFALFFLAAGLTVMLADAARAAESEGTRRLAGSVLLAITLTLAVSEAPLALDLPAGVRRLAQAPQQVAYAYLQRHPGEAYFPWFPQSHYFAEHKFRHYAFGVVDRLMAGEPVTPAAFRAYIPADPRVIAFSADGTPELFGFDLMRYLPAYRYQVKDPELPGWLVYSRTER